AQSPVFADMLSFPPSQDQEILDGCPLVEMPDDPMSVEFFLRAVTQPDFFLPPPAASRYHIVAGILRIAHKYDCSLFRIRALRHLSARFPTRLIDYTHGGYISKSLFNGYSSEERDVYRLDCLSLLFEVDALWCLPLRYQSLIFQIENNPGLIINGVDFQSRHYQITSAQHIALIKGKAGLTRDITALVAPFSSAPSECTQGGCQKYRRKLLTTFIKIPPKRVLNPWWGQWFDLESPASNFSFCRVCREKLKRDYENLQKKSWDQLPLLFGLPPWGELNQMKRVALGYEYTGPLL
ncbi:hypothetical protein DL96DRAFT_1608169, partial [Flagelloscypha sp. PMI_526]